MARPSISIFGNRYVLPKGMSPTRIARNEKDFKLYRIEADTNQRFSLESTITRMEYERVMKYYDLRIIEWTPGILPKTTGRKIFYISGKNRHLVKNVASEYADEVHEQRNYIVAVGNKIRAHNIKIEAEEIGTILWLKAILVTGLPKDKVKNYTQLNRLK